MYLVATISVPKERATNRKQETKTKGRSPLLLPTALRDWFRADIITNVVTLDGHALIKSSQQRVNQG